MKGKFIVPKRLSKGIWQGMIRRKLDEKFRYDERVKNVYITEDLKCLVTTARPIMHDNPYHRIEFETQERNLEFEIEPRKCYEVMEG
jgi:hypothetical protein